MNKDNKMTLEELIALVDQDSPELTNDEFESAVNMFETAFNLLMFGHE